MTTTPVRRSRLVGLAAAGVAMAALAACGAPTIPADSPAFTPAAATPVPPLAAQDCDDATTSYAPYASLAEAFPKGSLQAQIRDKSKFLVVGVSGDSLLLGARDPNKPDSFSGFDIDLARAVARAIYGPGGENRVQFRVITAAQRIPLVNAGSGDGGIDMVARNMTMTCSRWKDVNFSATYYVAEQRVLVPSTASVADPKNATKVPQILGSEKARVCAPAGSTSIQRIANDPRFNGIVPVEVDQHTTCLAMLQQNRVDAITGDSTVLAGLAAQDTHVTVLDTSYGAEPYGLAVSKEHKEFAQFVNTVLQDYISSGRWQKSYDSWFAKALGPGTPPTLQFGRP